MFKPTREEINKERNRFEEYLKDVWADKHGGEWHKDQWEDAFEDWRAALNYDEILDYAAAYTLMRVEEVSVK